MPLSLLLLILAAFLIVSLVAGAAWLWLAAQWCLEEPPSLAQALGVHLALWATSHALVLAVGQLRSSPQLEAASVVVVGLLAVVVYYVAFRTTWGRAAALMCVVYVIGSVVAYPLALAFRTYVAEAFVVPTGSMAETILGRHLPLPCAVCGGVTRIGFSEHQEHSSGRSFAARCRYCETPLDPAASPATTGDRILADRFVTPERWSLATFTPPGEDEQVFVARIVGLPGEFIEIRDGDVFANGVRLVKQPSQAASLWIPLYDSRRDSAQFLNSSQWAREPLLHEGKEAEGSETAWHNLRSTMPEAVLARYDRLIDASLSYNASNPRRRDEPPLPLVSDIRLACRIAAAGEHGSLTLLWQHGGRNVLAPFGETLANPPSEERRLVERSATPLQAGEELALVIRDGHLWIARNGNWIVQQVELPAVTAAAGERPAATVGLIFDSQSNSPRACELEWLTLDRDVHYLAAEEMRQGGRAGGPKGNLLGPEEYFFLGDNSPSSNDSRFFGPVHRGAIKGSARLRYWPADRIGSLD